MLPQIRLFIRERVRQDKKWKQRIISCIIHKPIDHKNIWFNSLGQCIAYFYEDSGIIPGCFLFWRKRLKKTQKLLSPVGLLAGCAGNHQYKPTKRWMCLNSIWRWWRFSGFSWCPIFMDFFLDEGSNCIKYSIFYTRNKIRGLLWQLATLEL